MSRFALEGIHVLDFAWVGVGPITAKYLADNGADVIRVESAARPDVLRIGPPWKDAQPRLMRTALRRLFGFHRAAFFHLRASRHTRLSPPHRQRQLHRHVAVRGRDA